MALSGSAVARVARTAASVLAFSNVYATQVHAGSWLDFLALSQSVDDELALVLAGGQWHAPSWTGSGQPDRACLG